jgi:hypothetical protein
MNQARLLERRSMFDTKWPHDRFSATLDGDSLFRLRVCTSAHAIEKLDRLSANEYWGLRLLNLALSFAVEFPLVESDIDAAATLLRDEALAGDRELLLRTLNDGLFDELSQTDLQTAKDCAFIITDEANPYVENQLTINPIFCL